MASIRVSDFIRASRTHVEESVARVNRDQNGYLTKAEATKLPKDLQDNFEKHRVLAQDNGRVSVKKFQENFVKYVEAYVRKADGNGDGILSEREVKTLPKDLRDNFANYAKAADVENKPKSMTALRQQIAESVNGQDWKAFLKLCDPETRQMQRSLGIYDNQYIAEALGLHMVNNTLPGDITKRSTLEQIERITLKSKVNVRTHGTLELTGKATLKDGTTLDVVIWCRELADGRFEISPAVG